MLRKLCKTAGHRLMLALVLVACGRAAQAQALKPTTEQAAAPTEAAIWGRTAEYVYKDDPELKAIAGKLVEGIGRSSLRSFKLSLNAAVKLEGKPLTDSHVFTFQSKFFDKVQAQHPPDAAALATAIQNELLSKRSSRATDKSFQALRQNLLALAGATTDAGSTPPVATPASQAIAGAATTPATAAQPAADTVQPTVAATPPVAPAVPTSPLLWLALGMSGLSLAGVILLLTRSRPDASSPPASDQERVPRTKDADPIKWDQITRYVQQELAKVPPGAVATPKNSAAAKVIPPAKAPADAQAPNANSNALAAATAPALEVDPAPAALSPEEDSLFAIAPPVPPAPRLRTQYVDEAPFNNNFPARALRDQPGTYSLFAIESTEQLPDQGTFTVTGNHASHIRDHRNVLEPVCEYASYPGGSETRIVTEQAGQVRRRGQDWEVTSPAKIRFE